MFSQLKLYAYMAAFAAVTSVAGYGYYLYNKVGSLEAEKVVMQQVIDSKDSQMKDALEKMAKVTQELDIVRSQSSVIDAVAQQRKADLDNLKTKNQVLWGKIQASQKPEEFNGQVNSEFVSVLACIEKATGKADAKCEAN